MRFLKVVQLLLALKIVLGMMTYNLDKNISVVAIALCEIIIGLKPKQLTILADTKQLYPNEFDKLENDEHIQKHVDDFIYQLHKLYFKSVIFYDVELFFKFIEDNLQGSIESVNLIFSEPYELSQKIQERKLSHRLSLFIFYWGAKHPPKASQVHFKEPIRAVVITRPRNKAFRIYYNQAVPDGNSNLKLVNWYDGDNLGLQKVPLLPSAAIVYSNFNGRVFRVPVFHSPPWFWVNYENESNTNNLTTNMADYLSTNSDSIEPDYYTMETQEIQELNVTGGRDHRLLRLLAKHMNFQFVYIETPGRTQGSLHADGEVNESFTGGIGLLQNGQADLLLGDVSLSWERRRAVEFSFFTLADSGAFATHAPRRLNEALAIIRPFKLDVWPYLILTVLFSGPIFYAIIAIPYKWYAKPNHKERDVEKVGDAVFYMVYIKEITINSETTRKLLRQQNLELARVEAAKEMPKNLLDRCIWFTVQLFLKQSCQEPYHGYRAKFLMIVFWIAATYVLADVYSAQLTSQFARPAHEPPINTLQRLEKAMIEDGYRLYVEKESSSLEMLEHKHTDRKPSHVDWYFDFIFQNNLLALGKFTGMYGIQSGFYLNVNLLPVDRRGLDKPIIVWEGERNGTEVFRHLFALMKQQMSGEEGYLIDSVESGLGLIADGFENKAVLGGRETLFFNIQQFGAKSFQLSQKLYTRYSAVAVQIGCPFLDSLNDVLIHLFEGGILDKMTIAEYETQSRMISKEISYKQKKDGTTTAAEVSTNDEHGNTNKANGKTAENADAQQSVQNELVIQPLNLRMLQGAFIVLFVGYGAAACILLLELLCYRMNYNFHDVQQILMRRKLCLNCRKWWQMARLTFMRTFR